MICRCYPAALPQAFPFDFLAAHGPVLQRQGGCEETPKSLRAQYAGRFNHFFGACVQRDRLTPARLDGGLLLASMVEAALDWQSTYLVG